MTRCPSCGGTAGARVPVKPPQEELRRCRACGVVHRGSRWAAAQVADHYRDYYAGRLPEFDVITEKRYEAILNRFERIGRRGRLLDVGCGAGHFIATAERRGWQPVGLEVSTTGVQLLERIRAERRLSFELVTQPLAGANLPGGSFAAITMFEVLEHLTDPADTLRRIQALLQPGGILYLTTPNFDSLSRYALSGRWRGLTRDHLCLFNVRAMRTLLASSGFSRVHLATKNVDVPEILAKLRARRPNGSAYTFEATQTFRRTIEGSRWLGLIKSAANGVLRVSGLGDTIEVLATTPR